MTRVETKSATVGATTVDNQIYSKIAAKAASKIPGVGASSGGLLQLGKPRAIAGKPAATAEVLGGTVAVKLKVGIRYPLSLQQTCEAIRQQVTDELVQFLGVSSVQVDIDVAWLHAVSANAEERSLL
ncbi:Asp23/Gls24 family envelope stress response protein [Glutamicibacter sp. NPDC087661]|uniref:Asp23/Gls24 family envelope stress response protein n=1 Tax=Glutamicibacter sp. NPDC087661 TaxID=3363996 RepID=UPI0037FC1E19